MTSHLHAWSPVPGETAQYVCTCSATGYRNSSGIIVAHKTRRTYARRWTAKTTWERKGRIAEDYDGPKEKE